MWPGQGKRERIKFQTITGIGGRKEPMLLMSIFQKYWMTLKKNNVEIIHQTGNKDWKVTAKRIWKAWLQCQLCKTFIEDIAYGVCMGRYSFMQIRRQYCGRNCAWLVCRQFFVPFPAAIHMTTRQRTNARALEMAGLHACPEDKIGEAGNILLDLMNKPESLKRCRKMPWNWQRLTQLPV